MSKRVYTARNHPAMPKDPAKNLRVCLDFPDIESMLTFRDALNNGGDHELGHNLRVFKLDMFDMERVPMGNQYYMSVHTDEESGRTELTREIIKVQRTKYDRKTKQ